MSLSTITVIGAGTMGHGIAHAAALAGNTVNLFDVNQDGLRHGLDSIAKNLDKGVARGKVQAE
ncbi:MAG: 3-hydroxybutyryl-CoA dehydrogenase, partial [Cognaticolwellia sp.]